MSVGGQGQTLTRAPKHVSRRTRTDIYRYWKEDWAAVTFEMCDISRNRSIPHLKCVPMTELVVTCCTPVSYTQPQQRSLFVAMRHVSATSSLKMALLRDVARCGLVGVTRLRGTFWLLLLGGVEQSVQALRPFSYLLCIPIWVTNSPDSATIAIWLHRRHLVTQRLCEKFP
jgi:hypothetical protein